MLYYKLLLSATPRTLVGTKYEQRLNYGGHGIGTIKMQTLFFSCEAGEKRRILGTSLEPPALQRNVPSKL